MWTFYILFSVNLDKYYIGYTGDDLTERLRRHNTYHKGFTGGHGDWKIMYSEIYDLKQSAQKREKQVKGWKSHIMVKKLIGSEHPD